MISTVSATGAIEPEGQVSLVFRGAGRVGEVLAKEGDAVTAGQVLARLETDDLDLGLAQAETALVISQAQLDRLKTPVDEIDLTAAEAAVASAQASVESAQAALASAQAARLPRPRWSGRGSCAIRPSRPTTRSPASPTWA